MGDLAPNVSIESVEPDTNVLISGPPIADTRGLAVELLAAPAAPRGRCRVHHYRTRRGPAGGRLRGTSGSDDGCLRVGDARRQGANDRNRVEVTDSASAIMKIGSATSRRPDYVPLG